MKCRNCGCKIDVFIGKETGAKAYLHVLKLSDSNVDNETGYLWSWTEESKQHCRNPEPSS